MVITDTFHYLCQIRRSNAGETAKNIKCKQCEAQNVDQLSHETFTTVSTNVMTSGQSRIHKVAELIILDVQSNVVA